MFEKCPQCSMKLDAGDSSCPLCGLTLREMAEFGSRSVPGQAAAPATPSSSGPDLAALDKALAGELEKLLLPALERPDPTIPEYAAYKFTEPDKFAPPVSPPTAALEKSPEPAPAGAAPLGNEKIEEELLAIEALGVNLENLDIDFDRLDGGLGDLDGEESEGEQGPTTPQSESLGVEIFEPEDFAVDVAPAKKSAPPKPALAGESVPETRLDHLFAALTPKPPRGAEKTPQDEAPAPDAEPPLPPGVSPEIARLERALHNESLAVRKQAARKLKELILREYGSPQTPFHPDAKPPGAGPLAGSPGP